MPAIPVNIKVIDNPGNFEISVTPNIREVRKPAGGNGQILEFKVTPPGSNWSFDANAAKAIKIDDPTGQFVGLTKKNPKLIEVDDKCTKKGDYKYTINLVNNVTNAVCSIDPLIRNN